MTWSVVLTADGSYTLAHPVHGQTCHSRAGAWQEARERYAQACRLNERARAITERDRDHEKSSVLRLLDIGTGLGLNLAAALEALSGTGVALEVISLEHDESVIASTLDLFERPSDEVRRSLPVDLERWHAPVRGALRAALENRAAATGLAEGSLRLLLGDARATLRALPSDVLFDAVFLDPFSPGVEPDLWEFAFLEEVARRMAGGSLLSTYTSALGVRARLLAAGLEVGPGPRVGTKASGTLAARGVRLDPFDARTARRVASRAALCRGASADRIPSPPSVSDRSLI
jgi:chorismate dehydratase